MTEENSDQKNNQLQVAVKDLIPRIDFEGVEKFYSEVESIVKQMFKLGYHYGPPYEVRSGKEPPKNILYKAGVQVFVDRINLLFEDEVTIIDEVSQHKTFHCKSKMFRLGNNTVLSSGEGSCSTDEGRFSYQAYDKIVTRHVRESAILRAHKDSIERFFNVSRFFPDNKKLSVTPKQESKPQQKKEPEPTNGKGKWNPTPQQRNDPEWFIGEIKKLKNHGEVNEFHEKFELDEKFFGEVDQKKIHDAYAARWEELKK